MPAGKATNKKEKKNRLLERGISCSRKKDRLYIYIKKGDNRHISSVKELGRRARASRIHLSRHPWVKTNTFCREVSVQHNQTGHAPHNHRRWLAAHRCYPELATTTDRSPVKSQRAKQASEKEAMIVIFRGAACGGAGSWRHEIIGHSRDCADKIYTTGWRERHGKWWWYNADRLETTRRSRNGDIPSCN